MCVLVLSGCGHREIALTEKDDGRKIRISTGESMSVSLESNPTTGYIWEPAELDGKILKFKKGDFKPSSDLVGAPGRQIFCFKGMLKGKTSLKLIYHRSWEKSVPSAKTFSITVEVR
ncbi:MAG TPA: protease inhibitor I42 family protein [Candidatus Omnitrophota bacterium]|nr:protease inhibitor I42 family protein [Candidatus Omnitrophota bacterium]